MPQPSAEALEQGGQLAPIAAVGFVQRRRLATRKWSKLLTSFHTGSNNQLVITMGH